MQEGTKKKKWNKTLQRMWKDRYLYLLISPTLLYFLIFRVWPIINMRLAFYDYKARGPWEFAGLKYSKCFFYIGICHHFEKHVDFKFHEVCTSVSVLCNFCVDADRTETRSVQEICSGCFLSAAFPFLGRYCRYLDVIPCSV